jgi:hypothetical protein
MSDSIFWSVEDNEELSHTDLEDAVEEYLDDFMSPRMTQADWDAIPETVEVIGYKRMDPLTVGSVDHYGPLDHLLESLDDEFGDPNGNPTDRTSAMEDAAEEFVGKVLAEYTVWACEPSGEKETINCRDWIKANRPEWMEEKP